MKNDNNNFKEYQNICYKVLEATSQVKKFRVNITGWSIGYDPHAILNDARYKLKTHEERIKSNYE